MRLELDDLPPRYREQAEAQLAMRLHAAAKNNAALDPVAWAQARIGREFESRGEYEYYMQAILPGIQSGKIAKARAHVTFPLYGEKEYGNVKCPAAHYTPDFVIEYATGEVEVVEIKSKFTRRAQRDYIYRRRAFIDKWAEPKGWKFTEIITPDTKEEIRAWKRAAKGETKSK